MDRDGVLDFLRADRLKLATVSGVLTTTAGLIEWVDREIPGIEVITTKSYEVEANPGNREPVITEPLVGSFGNSVGLRNPGMEKGFRDLGRLRGRRKLRALLSISLSGKCAEDFVRLAERFGALADILELNFSCPHAKGGYGAAIGSRRDLVAAYLREIRRVTGVVLVAKLTPNVEDIGSIAAAAVEAGADGIAAINTAGPELYLEPHSGAPILYNPNGHKGGKSGEWVREIALQKVAEIRKAIGPSVPIFGMGGMTRGEDLVRMREAGASVVGIGSSVIRMATQEAIPRYVAALREDAELGTNRAEAFLLRKPQMEFHPYPVSGIRQIGENLRQITVEGELEYEASQFVFLFLPGRWGETLRHRLPQAAQLPGPQAGGVHPGVVRPHGRGRAVSCVGCTAPMRRRATRDGQSSWPAARAWRWCRGSRRSLPQAARRCGSGTESPCRASACCRTCTQAGTQWTTVIDARGARAGDRGDAGRAFARGGAGHLLLQHRPAHFHAEGHGGPAGPRRGPSRGVLLAGESHPLRGGRLRCLLVRRPDTLQAGNLRQP